MRGATRTPGVSGADRGGTASDLASVGRRAGMENVLHWRASEPDVLWSPGNVSEAFPGVATPLHWSFVDDAVELATRRCFCAIGVLSSSEVELHDRAEDRIMTAFYGRAVANIEAMRRVGDRMPGTSANAVEKQLFGVVRDDAENAPTLSRVPVITLKMPRAATTLPARQWRLRSEIVAWWREQVLAPPADLEQARALLADAREVFVVAFELGGLSTMLAQAVYDQIVALCERAGQPGLELRLVTGYGDLLESSLLAHVWDVAHDEMDLASFVLHHGFQGPGQGQLSGRTWREDTASLESLARRYRGRPDHQHPALNKTRQVDRRTVAEAELLAALPRAARFSARVTLRIARAIIPQREIGKANYTQCLDAARLAARVIGRELVAAGQIDDEGDVFYLTYDEALGRRVPEDLRAVIGQRRALREDYLTTALPEKWTGPPVRVPLDDADAERGDRTTVDGVAVGGGLVTARVRVIIDPDEDDLEEGEILVCRNTDPSWTALFHLAGGIAVDMGGHMSHGAIVARELGLPCVTSTVDGTRALRTGDLVRLDGDNGTIEILEGANDK